MVAIIPIELPDTNPLTGLTCTWKNHPNIPIEVCFTHKQRKVCGPFNHNVCLQCEKNLERNCLLCNKIVLECYC